MALTIAAAVLAVCFSPATGALRHEVEGTAADGLIVFGLLALATIVGFATVPGVTQQTADIASLVDSAMGEAATELELEVEVEVDPASLGEARRSTGLLPPGWGVSRLRS